MVGWLNELVWENSYVRRWLLKDGVSFETNDADELVMPPLGKGPRDYFESKLFFNINDYFNPFIAYDWGKEPRSFKLVDHRFRVGFTYKFKVVPQKN